MPHRTVRDGFRGCNGTSAPQKLADKLKILGLESAHLFRTNRQASGRQQALKSPHSNPRSGFQWAKFGRGERIRTSVLYVPNVALYQTNLNLLEGFRD